jgi:hypothetical protein
MAKVPPARATRLHARVLSCGSCSWDGQSATKKADALQAARASAPGPRCTPARVAVGPSMRRRCMPTVVDEWGSRPPQVHRTAGCRPVGPNPPLTMCGPAPVKDTSAHPTARLAQKRLRHAHLGKPCVSGRAGLILQDEHFAGRAFCKTGPDRILPPSPHSQSARAGEGPPNSARGCAWCAACDAFSRVSRRRSASRIPPTAATAYRDP